VEHLAKNRQLSAIQTAFLDAGVVQCGYCTPAMLLATKQLLEKTPQPTREQIKSAFSGIFCRCTGYEQYFAAVDLASRRLKDPESLAAKGPEFRDHLRVVGKAIPVRVYELLAKKGEMDPKTAKLAAAYNEGLEHFYKGVYEKAKKDFKAALEVEPKDGPSAFYLDLAEKYSVAVPKDWDGTFNLTSK